MLIDHIQLIDILDMIKTNLIEDNSDYGGFAYKRVEDGLYEVEGVAQIHDQGKVGVIYIPKTEGGQG